MTKICYFSGTGNSLWSSKKIAESIGDECELINIGVEAEKSEIILEAEAVILIYPAYAYGAPVLVREFARKAVVKAGYIAIFVTYGTLPGGAFAEIGGILRSRNNKVSYYGNIPSVENYIALFGPQSPKTVERRLGKQIKATNDAINAITARKSNSIITFRPLSAFISLLFSMGKKLFYKIYKVSETCNGCGICAQVCPVAAIAMRDKRPVFSHKCEHCQACLNWCPQNAIHFARINSATPRYHHPEITVADLAR